MKRILPLLALSALFVATPAFADDSDSSIVAQVPATAAVTTERPRLNLTDAQLEQLRALKDKNFEANAMKKTQLQILKHQLRSELTKENVDRSAVLAIQSKINAAQADLANARIVGMLDAQAVFTPEQRKMMHERMLRGGFGRHHGRGHGKHGGPGFRGHGGPGGHFGGRAEGPEGPFAPQLSEGPEPQFEMPQAEMPDMPDTDGVDS